MRYLLERGLARSGGRFVSLTFRKLDGSIRKYNGRVVSVRADYVTIKGVRGEGYKSLYADRIVRLAQDRVTINQTA